MILAQLAVPLRPAQWVDVWVLVAVIGILAILTLVLAIAVDRLRRARPAPPPGDPADATPTVRPRFGRLVHRDGACSPVVFRAVPGHPELFTALYAGDERPVVVYPGETVTADVLGPGQAIKIKFADGTRP